MPKCGYCGKMYDIPKGLTLVGKDGVIHYLCSSKCRKNRALKRRKVRWVLKSANASAKLTQKKGKELVSAK